jgi:hypothetical protein
MVFAPSLNCTWPVAVEGVTVAVRVNDWVVVMGLADVVRVVVVGLPPFTT